MPGFSWRVKQYASARMAVGIKRASGKKANWKKANGKKARSISVSWEE